MPGKVDLRHIYSNIYPTEIDGGLKRIVEEESLGIKNYQNLRWDHGDAAGH
jgi:hypothetical protein